MALEHAENGEVVHLEELARDTRSTALVKTGQFEAIHLVVPKGSTIPTHRVSGQATLHCLTGRVRLSLAESSPILRTGDWLFLESCEDHSVEGLEDSAILLTILFDHAAPGRS